jgi:SPP1 family predicted phage head-tail adaptor
MNPGLLNKRITFSEPTVKTDEYGNQIEQWADVKTVWAMIKTEKGSEYVSAGAERTELIYRFIVRYTTGINASMRIVYNGRTFDIIEPPINDDEANKTLTILAKERG